MTAKTRAARRSQWEQQEVRRQRLLVAFWVFVGVAFVAMLAYLGYKQAHPVPRPGVDFPIQGRNHIARREPHHPYNSDPPTSGRHYPTLAQSGLFEIPPADQYLLHR